MDVLLHSIQVEDGSFLEVSGVEEVQTSTPQKRRRLQQNSHKKLSCSIGSCMHRSTSRVALLRHKRIYHTGNFYCQHCACKFTTNAYLATHILVQHAKKYGPCETCGKMFYRRCLLHFHRAVAHDVEEISFPKCPFDQCKKIFMTMQRLNRHITAHITGYNCTNCNKNFTSVQYFAIHSQSCGSEKSHVCEFCNKRFAFKTSLDDHKNSVHFQKDFFCNCGKNFKWRSSLLRHKRRGCSASNVPPADSTE